MCVVTFLLSLAWKWHFVAPLCLELLAFCKHLFAKEKAINRKKIDFLVYLSIFHLMPLAIIH